MEIAGIIKFIKGILNVNDLFISIIQLYIGRSFFLWSVHRYEIHYSMVTNCRFFICFIFFPMKDV